MRRPSNKLGNGSGNENPVITERVGFGEQMWMFLRGHANLLLAGAVALLLLQDVFGTHGLLAMRHSQRQAAEVQKQIDHLSEENKQLQQQVKSLNTDPSAIERIARQENGLAKPGEIIFKIAPRQSASGSTSTNSTHKP